MWDPWAKQWCFHSLVKQTMERYPIYKQMARQLANKLFLYASLEIPHFHCLNISWNRIPKALIWHTIKDISTTLCLVRRVFEHAFGKLKAFFCILNIMEAEIPNAVSIIEVCCTLLNIYESLDGRVDSRDDHDGNQDTGGWISVTGYRSRGPKQICTHLNNLRSL